MMTTTSSIFCALVLMVGLATADHWRIMLTPQEGWCDVNAAYIPCLDHSSDGKCQPVSMRYQGNPVGSLMCGQGSGTSYLRVFGSSNCTWPVKEWAVGDNCIINGIGLQTEQHVFNSLCNCLGYGSSSCDNCGGGHICAGTNACCPCQRRGGDVPLPGETYDNRPPPLKCSRVNERCQVDDDCCFSACYSVSCVAGICADGTCKPNGAQYECMADCQCCSNNCDFTYGTPGYCSSFQGNMDERQPPH